MIEIMNLKNIKPSESYDFIIDRRTPVGNPFIMSSEKYRDYVCDQYQEWFDNAINEMLPSGRLVRYLEKIREAYNNFNKVRLFCWCTPKRCHGETIKKWLENV